MHINRSSPEIEGELQASKARKLPLLIDHEEMVSLFEALGDFEIFDGSRPVRESEMVISKKAFLEAYGVYVEGIKAG